MIPSKSSSIAPPVNSPRTKRVSRACDHCRRLKEKCEGGVPCRRCVHTRRACEFRNAPQNNRDVTRPTGGINVTNDEFRQTRERLALMETILRHTIKDTSFDTDNLRRIAQLCENIESTEELGHSQETEQVSLEQEPCTISPVEDSTTHYSGELSYWNFSMKLKRLVDDNKHYSPHANARESVQTPTYWRSGHLGNGNETLQAAISCCPPRPIAEFLLDVFFKYGEGHLFYIDRSWLVEKVHLLFTDVEKLMQRHASGTIGIILMILAIGTQYAYLESNADNSTGLFSSDCSEDEVGAVFYQHAIRLLPELIETSSMQSVQACLLFALYALPIDASGLGFIYINLANRLAIQNGMHRKYRGTALSPAIQEIRNRIWWTLVTIERKIALFHGRPLSIQQSDVDADFPLARSELPEDNFSPKILYMLASVKLGELHEESSRMLLQLWRKPQAQVKSVLNEALSMKRTLDLAWTNIRAGLNNDPEISMTLSRAGRHLRLEYCLIRMFIGRPFMLDKSQPQYFNTPARRDEQQHVEALAPNTTCNQKDCLRVELVTDCLRAAKDSLETLLALRDNRPGLARASYIEYSSCRASLLVLIAHSIQTRSDEYSDILQDGLSMVRSMASTGESARSEVLLIEALEQALQRSYTSTQSSRATARSFPIETGYDGFKSWHSRMRATSQMSTNEVPSVRESSTPAAEDVNMQKTDDSPRYGSNFGRATRFDTAFEGQSSRQFQPDMNLSFLNSESFVNLSEWPYMPESQVVEELLAMPAYLHGSETSLPKDRLEIPNTL